MNIKRQAINALCKNIRLLITQTKQQVAHSVNVGLLYSYWHTGKLIVQMEISEGYDEMSTRELLTRISPELSTQLGKGFSRNQLTYMRLFYKKFEWLAGKKRVGLTLSDQPVKRKNRSGLTLSDQISWSHYVELLKCSHDEEIGFYMQLCLREKLTVRELRIHQQKALFERVLLSKTKKKAIPYPAKKTNTNSLDDFYRDPMILEFLNISPNYKLTEKRLEQKILDNLQQFILELGKGFAFVGRQYRVSLDGKNYYIDLVFYHYVLKCFVLVDLKIEEVQHQDIGQMNFYLNYFKKEVSSKDDNAPIGIILSKYKNDLTVEFALGGITNNIFVRKYQLYLPDKKLLEKKITSFFNNA
jgi:predicted nuclease of restriction endonuclease-like (RecB) superfamily